MQSGGLNTSIKHEDAPFIVTPPSVKSRSLAGALRRSSSGKKQRDDTRRGNHKRGMAGPFGGRRRTTAVYSDSDEDLEMDGTESFGKTDDSIGETIRRTSDIAAGIDPHQISDADDDIIDSDAEFEAAVSGDLDVDGGVSFPKFGKSKFPSRSTTTSTATTTCNSSVVSSSGLASQEGSEDINMVFAGPASSGKSKSPRRQLLFGEAPAPPFSNEERENLEIEKWEPIFPEEQAEGTTTVADSMSPQSLSDWMGIGTGPAELATQLQSPAPQGGNHARDDSTEMNQSLPNIGMSSWLPPPPLHGSDDGDGGNPAISPGPRRSFQSLRPAREDRVAASKQRRSLSDASSNQTAMLDAFSWQSPKRHAMPKTPVVEQKLLSPNSANPRMVLRSNSNPSISASKSGPIRNGSGSSVHSGRSEKPMRNGSNCSSRSSGRPKYERTSSFGTHSSEVGEHWEPRRPQYQQRRGSATSEIDMAQIASAASSIMGSPSTNNNNLKRSDSGCNLMAMPQHQRYSSSYYDMYCQYYYYQQHYYQTMVAMQQQHQLPYQQHGGPISSSSSVSSVKTTPIMSSHPPLSTHSQYSFHAPQNRSNYQSSDASVASVPVGNTSTTWTTSGWPFATSSFDWQSNQVQSSSSQFIAPDTPSSLLDPKSVFEALDAASTGGSTVGTRSTVIGEMSLNDNSEHRKKKKDEDWVSPLMNSPQGSSWKGSGTRGVAAGNSERSRSALRRRHSMSSVSLSTRSRSTIGSTTKSPFPSPNDAKISDFDKESLTSFFEKQKESLLVDGDYDEDGEHGQTSRHKHRRNNSLGTSTADLEYETQFFEEADALAKVTSWRDISGGAIPKTPVVRKPSISTDDDSEDDEIDDHSEDGEGGDDTDDEGAQNEDKSCLDEPKKEEVEASEIPTILKPKKTKKVKKPKTKKKLQKASGESEEEEGRPTSLVSPSRRKREKAGDTTSSRTTASSCTLVTGTTKKKKKKSDKAKKVASTTGEKKKKKSRRPSLVDTEDSATNESGGTKKKSPGTSPSKTPRKSYRKKDKNTSDEVVANGQRDNAVNSERHLPVSTELPPPPMSPMGKRIGGALKVLRRWKNGKAKSKIRGS